MKATFVIRSRPYAYYECLTSVAKCVFVYLDDWDLDSLSGDEGNASNVTNEVQSEDGIRADCGHLDSLMKVISSFSSPVCLSTSEVGRPIHYRSSNMNDIQSMARESTVVLDLEQASCNDWPSKYRYVSIGGLEHAKDCLEGEWSTFDPMMEISTDDTQIEKFYVALGQSLKDTYIICNKSMSSHIRCYL
jgi:hypothetical protein